MKKSQNASHLFLKIIFISLLLIPTLGFADCSMAQCQIQWNTLFFSGLFDDGVVDSDNRKNAAEIAINFKTQCSCFAEERPAFIIEKLNPILSGLNEKIIKYNENQAIEEKNKREIEIAKEKIEKEKLEKQKQKQNKKEQNEIKLKEIAHSKIKTPVEDKIEKSQEENIFNNNEKNISYEEWQKKLTPLCPKDSIINPAGGDDLECVIENETQSIIKSPNSRIKFGFDGKNKIYVLQYIVGNQLINPPVKIKGKYEDLMMNLNPHGYQQYLKEQKSDKAQQDDAIIQRQKIMQKIEKENWSCPKGTALQALDRDVVDGDKGMISGFIKACINGDQRIIGKAIIWFPNGIKASEANYTIKGIEGLLIEWDSKSRKISEAYFKNGVLNGTSTVWSKNGDYKTSTFLNGILHGKEFGKIQGIKFEAEYNYGKKIK